MNHWHFGIDTGINEGTVVRRLMILALALNLLAPPIVAVVPGSSDAQDSPPAETTLRKAVEELIHQLDAELLAERTKAERGILDLGPDVLPLLPAPELIASVSVREAVKRIRVQLERQAARESAQSSLVSLSADITASNLLKEITTQTRNRVEFSDEARGLANTSLRIDYEKKPFWECLDDVCERLKLRAAFNPQRGCLTLRPRATTDPKELTVQRSGPFRLAIHAADARPIVGDTSRRLVRILGKLQLEPRLRPLFLHFAASEVSASGSRGQFLPPWNPNAKYELPVGDAGREVPVQFDYLFPAKEDQTSVDLRGKIFVQLAAGTERIVFDRTSLTPGAARRRGGVTVRLRDVVTESIPEDRTRAEIKVVVTYDAGGPAFESHRTWMFHNAVFLEDDTGKRLDYTDFDTSLQINGGVGVDYRWAELAGPITSYRFVYEAPTLIVDVPLEIALKQIPVKAVAGDPPAPKE